MNEALNVQNESSNTSSRDIEDLAILLQHLGEAETDRNVTVNSNGVSSNSVRDNNWSIETNESDTINFEYRREIIASQLQKTLEADRSNEIVSSRFASENQIQSVKLIKTKIISIYDKYYNAGKRRLFWSIWEKYRGNYESYKEFKEYNGSNLKVRTEIKKLWESNGNPFDVKKFIDRKR